MISDCSHGCLTTDRSYGTTRVFTPDQITPTADPRTTTVTIDPRSTTARGGYSKNLITPNPNYFGSGGAGVPLPDRGTANTGVGAGGQVNKPGKGAVFDFSGRSQYELRIARAVPDSSYPVNTQFGPGTAVRYHYEYEARSITGITAAGVDFNGFDGWAPVNSDQVNDLVNKGVPLPRIN